jgi:hypothetical protein
MNGLPGSDILTPIMEHLDRDMEVMFFVIVPGFWCMGYIAWKILEALEQIEAELKKRS